MSDTNNEETCAYCGEPIKKGQPTVPDQWDDGSDSVELDIAGELPDESWIQLKGYGFDRNADIETIIDSIPRLLAAWEVMATFKLRLP